MNIIKNGEMIAEDIFDGRNSNWFRNLQREGDSPEYEFLPIRYGIPDSAPSFIMETYNAEHHNGYYGFHYINVGDFIDWFEEYKPELHAGWVTIYDWWLYNTKHIQLEEVYTNISSIPQDERDNYEFHEFINQYDCSLWLYSYLNDHHIPMDATIVYYFDC